MSSSCSICGADAVELLLDLGSQPLSNRFPESAVADQDRVPFRFGCCRNCGVARFIDPPAPELIRPKVDWIRYNEPEGHLDDMVDQLIVMDGVNTGCAFLGISYKEESTLQRLNERGYPNTRLLDLGIEDPRAGIETIQEQMTEETVEVDCADVIIVRHVLEHAQNTKQTVAALNKMLRPGGVIVYEVPDNTGLFENHEVCFLWEEHVLYFVPSTFRQTLGLFGYETEWMNNYAYPLENALVAFVRPAEVGRRHRAVAEQAFLAASIFVSTLEQDRARIRAGLAELRASGKTIAVFGAGHLAAKFINFYEVGEYLEFVADDHPGKQNKFMAGSGLPILPGSELKTRNIDLALMSLNPESEEKVMAKVGAMAPDLEFVSMFRSNPRSFLK